MAVSDGEDANEGTFNTAFMDRLGDTDTTGKVELKNVTEGGINAGSLRVQGGAYIAKSLFAKLGINFSAFAEATLTGAAQDLTLAAPITILTNASLTSVRNIVQLVTGYAGLIMLKNGKASGGITLTNNAGGTAGNRILTGTGFDMVIAAGAAVFLVYDYVNSRWQVVGGSGSGSGTTPSGTQFTLPDFANTDVTGLLFDKTIIRSVRVEWQAYRETTGVGANVRVACGSFYMIHNGTDWVLTELAFAEDAGVYFTVSNSSTGQVAVQTDAGVGTYDGTKSLLKWDVVHTMGL